MNVRIPLKGGVEDDVHTGWRRVLCYCARPGVCRRAKRPYNRRLRRALKQATRHEAAREAPGPT